MTDEKDRKDALKELGHLLDKSPGKLMIITNEHACCGGVKNYIRGETLDPMGRPRSYYGPPPGVCAGYKYTVKDPRHFVTHKVTELEGPDDRGRYRASSKEGDFTMGYPEDLLPRLLEVSKYST